MYTKKMKKISDEQTVKSFWFLLTSELKRTDFIEVRAVSIIDKEVYDRIRTFSEDYGVVCNNNCQLFFGIKDFHLFKIFMIDTFILNHCKLCYGLSPRQKGKDGKFSGGYANTGYASFIFFDIEKTTHSDTSDAEKKMLLAYTIQIAWFLERVGLEHYNIVDSGAGYHLLYRIPRTKLSPGKKRWFKFFIETMDEKLKNEYFHFDLLKDFTRIFGLPGSFNVKRGRKVELITFDPSINTDFKFGSKREKKVEISGEKHMIKGKMCDEPLVKFMMSFKHKKLQHGGSLSRNSYLELSLACLFRDNGLNVTDVKDIIHNININMNKVIQVNPKYVPKDYNFSKTVVNKWSMVECGVKIYD